MKRLLQLFVALTLITVFTGCADNAFDEIKLNADQQIKNQKSTKEAKDDGSISPIEGDD